MPRQVLGKGLDALLPDTPSVDSHLIEIDIDQIKPNDLQPRIRFEPESIAGLAKSIAENGILQPIIVRPAQEHEQYELIAGERRWRAAQQADLKRVPALVKDLSDEKMLEVALVENIQRDQLNVIEEAYAYRMLMDEFDLSQMEVADRVGRSRSAVANTVRLLSLSSEIQRMVLEGSLSMGQARALVPLPERQQVRLASTIAATQPSVRRVESMVQQLLNGPKEKVEARADPNLRAACTRLEETLRTKVEIVQRKNRAGRVVLHFHNDEELQRLFEALTLAP